MMLVSITTLFFVSAEYFSSPKSTILVDSGASFISFPTAIICLITFHELQFNQTLFK